MKRLLSSVWTPTTRNLRAWALAAVVANAGITVTGAAVRLTGSGLGCPTWPRCTADSFVPVAHPDHSPINTAIEFGNRMFSLMVLAVAVAVFVAVWRSGRRSLIPLALVQPLGVVFQAVWGGLVVRSALNPVTVSVHFLVSVGMIAAAYVLFARSTEGDGPVVPVVHPWIVTLSRILTGAMLVLLVAGVVTTGTGPHSGDERASRFDFDIEIVARIHADIVWIVVGLTFALLFALYLTKAPEQAKRAALILFGVEIAQGIIGYVQYFLAVPALLVGFHVLGAALVWIATLRVVHKLRERDEFAEIVNSGTVARV